MAAGCRRGCVRSSISWSPKSISIGHRLDKTPALFGTI
jgi:hypothetical protein